MGCICVREERWAVDGLGHIHTYIYMYTSVYIIYTIITDLPPPIVLDDPRRQGKRHDRPDVGRAGDDGHGQGATAIRMRGAYAYA